MKYIITGILISITMVFGEQAAAQEQELEELALNIEKLVQFKTILADLEKGYVMLEGGYNTIKNLSEGNFNIHKVFLDGLMTISPAVAKYKKIILITDMQLKLVREYKNAFKKFKADIFFNAGERNYMEKVYSNLVNESVKNLDALLSVITAGKLRMSDDERLHAIDVIADDMENKISFLQYFNNSITVLSLQRRKESNELNSSRLLSGIEK